MKVNIDRQNCAGHGRCAAIAPKIFMLDAEGYISTSDFDVPEGQETLVKRAARACPERIITVVE